MSCKLCAIKRAHVVYHKLLAKSLPKGRLKTEHFNRLYALVQRQHKNGRSFEETHERFIMVYGNKAASKKTIKMWYDALNPDCRRSTRRGVQTPKARPSKSSSMSKIDDVLSNIRCTIKRQNIPGQPYPRFSKHLVDARYVFFNIYHHPSHFFVMDTFNEDIQ